MTRAALRLATPETVAETVQAFDYSSLSDLHYALRAADEAVQMARGVPRRPDLAHLCEARDEMVRERLAELRKVLGNA